MIARTLSQMAPSRGAIADRCRVLGDADFLGRWGSERLLDPDGDLHGPGRSDGLDSVWTYVAVARIAEAIGRTPRRLLGPDDELIESGPLHDLLCRPNPEQDARDFIEIWVTTMLTRSAVAIVKDMGAPAAAGRVGSLPIAMYVADPRRLRPVWSSGRIRRTLAGWVYTRAEDGVQIPLAPEEVIAARLPVDAHAHPLEGLNPQTSTRRSIGVQRRMDEYALRYFEQDASPGMTLTTNNPMTEAQLRQAREEWDRRHRGVSRAHATAILHKGLRPFVASTMKDTAFAEHRKILREEQLAAYGVPPIVAGIVDDANRSNSEAQVLQFLLGPVMSHADRLVMAVNERLVSEHAWPSQPGSGRRMACSRFVWEHSHANRTRIRSHQQMRRRLMERAQRRGVASARFAAPAQDLYFALDFDADPTIAGRKLSQVTAAKTLWYMGAPLNHIYDLLDLAMPREPHGDIAFLPFSVAPASSVANPPDLSELLDDPSEGDDPQRGPGAPLGADHGPRTVFAEGIEASRHRGSKKQGAKATGERELIETALRGIAQRHRGTWAPLAAALQREYLAHLRGQLREVLANVRDHADELDPSRRAARNGSTRAEASADLLMKVSFDLRASRDRLAARVVRSQRDAARVGAAQGAHEAGLAPDAARRAAAILIEDPQVQLAVRKSRAAFTAIDSRRHAEVMGVIRDAFSDPSKGVAELIADLRQFYDGGFTGARRTALTETSKVLNSARHEGMRSQGVTGKLWISTSGERTRASHREAHARYGSTPIPIDEPFTVGGYALMHPGDPDGPAQEVIQCFCVQLAAFIDDAGERSGAEIVRDTVDRYLRRGVLTAEECGAETIDA